VDRIRFGKVWQIESPENHKNQKQQVWHDA